MSDKKTKQDGDSLVKKLLSSNLTWSVVALIVLIVICTISDHQFLSLSWNKNTGGIGALSHDRHRHDIGDLHCRHRPFRRFRYGGCRCGGHADADFRR